MTLKSRSIATATTLFVAAGCMLAATPAAQAASTQPTSNAASSSASFFKYDGAKPLTDYAPGDVLKSRTIAYHVAGFPIPVSVEQVLYRSTNMLGQAVANVTSIVKPAAPGPLEWLSPLKGRGKLVSYQSFYDSLNPEDGPSRAIAGDFSLGSLVAGKSNDGAIIPTAETAIIAPLLLQGYTVNLPDVEGQTAEFAAGPAYGQYTLDSLRAAYNSPKAGLNKNTKTAMLGYSGGAIATNWAAQLAPTYAPDVNKNLVGATEGGVLVAPAHNLNYISGTPVWAGVAAMAIKGVARALNLDFTPYLNAKGVELFKKIDAASITEGFIMGSGVKWEDIAKPEYANPNRIQIFVDTVNKVNMGQYGSPTIPLQIAQGATGVLEGTPGVGVGDGVMIAGDVRAIAKQFCASGTQVQYTEHYLLGHVGTTLAWYPGALSWINDRFAGKTAPNNCASIAAGNSLAPEVLAP